MAKGVRKIKWIDEDGKIYPNLSKPEKYVTIYPNQWVYFMVDKWESGTTADDKKKELTWMMQTMDKNIILSQKRSTKYYKIKIPKKLCGTYFYYIEASLSGKSDSRDVGVHVRGYSPALIVSSKWSRSNGGESIKNKFKAQPIVYGDIVYLSLQTEGLNGEEVTVEVYNSEATMMGKPTFTYPKVLVANGEVNLMIQNTHFWRNRLANPLSIQESKHEFCVKIKRPKTGKYIKDNGGGDLHATYLNVENGVSPIIPRTNTHQNITPTTVDKPDTNLEKYEPCKFTEIKISETEEKDGKKEPKTTTVFKDGQKLENVSQPNEKIKKAILFEFDSTEINFDEKKELDNILSFLLSNQHSNLILEGYACVIGKEEYNKELSEKRANSVKQFFTNGKLDPRRIEAVGRGEVTPTDDKAGRDNIRFKDEFENKEARTVYISFAYQGHDADTLVYNTIAPSFSKESKKPLTFDITEFQTDKCFRAGDKHEKKIKLKDIGQTVEKTFTTPSFVYEVYSDLSRLNVFPLQYIWPKRTPPNKVYIYLHSCRYYSDKEKTTILVNVHPDIKWELAFEFKIDIENSSHVNMPAGSFFAKHQEASRKAGYKRWLMNKNGEVPISIGLSLKAEWNNGIQKQNFTKDFEGKIETLAKKLSKSIELAQKAINLCKGVAEKTSIPISFGVEYPKFEVVGSWYLEKVEKQLPIAVVGEVNLVAKPFIGANATIDLIAAAITIASYATTGSPAIAKIVQKIRDFGKNVNAEISADAKFYGELEIKYEALKINSITGIKGGSLTIGGKMGLKITIELKVGTSKSKKKVPIINFSAFARATGDAYFGGDMKLDSDEIGLYIEPILKFSGLKITFEGEITVGWFSRGIYVEDVLVPENKVSLNKNYF